MKALVSLSVLLFASSALGFYLYGLPAFAAEQEERVALDQRVADLFELVSTAAPVSHEEIESFDLQLESLTNQLDERLLLMLESLDREQQPTLATVLTSGGPSWLALDSTIGRHLVELAAGRPKIDAALARALKAIAAAAPFDLESVEAHHDGALIPVHGIEQLSAYEAEFVVLCEVDQALQILEALSPEPGQPVLTVAAASLRRVEPALWPYKPIGLSSPPVRLWVTVTALFRAAPAREAR
ncbi:MAG: hypothetical protein ACI9EF_001783 [Pseudohongiellaceae bacterium]|jgi:hypothetical protein